MSAALILSDLEPLPLDDDADDDIDQLLTIICESSLSRRPTLETFDLGDFA
jgi:hypothetical protein